MHRFFSFSILLSSSTYEIEETNTKEVFVILVRKLYQLKSLNLLLLIRVSYYSLVAEST